MARERSDRAGRGCSPSQGREIFYIYLFRVSKLHFFCTLNVIIRGSLGEVAHINPLLLLLIVFTPIKGGGGGGNLYPLAMQVPVLQPGFVNLWSKRGSETTERG